MTRQILLDTETTGLSPKQGHRIIEVGCVEMVNRKLTGNTLHLYINPEREVDAGALRVHGISNEFLADKPVFSEVAMDIWHFIADADLIIHNAPFDLGFLNHEFKLLNTNRFKPIESQCHIIDTLVMAREMFKGARNSLDALCKRYKINNAHRTLHGALLDSEILADVYLAMTGGQMSISLADEVAKSSDTAQQVFEAVTGEVHVVKACSDAINAHEAYLDALSQTAESVVWRDLEKPHGD